MNNRKSDTAAGAECVVALLESLAREFVALPAEFRVVHEVAGDRLAVRAEPGPGDVGRMAGKNGVMFHSLALLLTVAAKRHGLLLHYSLKDKGEFNPQRGGAFVARSDWPRERILALMRATCERLFELPAAVRVKDVEGKTLLHVDLDPGEPRRVTDMELTDALSRVFHAIGRQNGRKLYVESVARRGKP